MPISTEEKQQIEKLRELVKDQITPYYDTDYNLLRWLKGHDFNFEAIKPKIQNHLFLRQSDWDLDSIADQPRDDPIHKHWRNGLTGPSGVLPNVLVNIEQSGMNDWWGMLETYPMNEILKSRVHDLEIMLKEVLEIERKTGERASVMYIMDLGGLSWDTKLPALLTGPLSALSSFMADHYVEMIHAFVLVNVPTFISAVWTIANPLLPEKTRKKVIILGGNWKTEILKYANPEVLPTFWNASGEDGPFKYNLERCVPYPPENFYKKTPAEKSQSLSIGAGKSAYHDIKVEEGEDVYWELHSDGHFAFGVYIVGDDPNEDTKQMEKAAAYYSKVPGPTLAPIIDTLRSRKSGTYRFFFSNQHAWFHTLRITHYIHTVRNNQ